MNDAIYLLAELYNKIKNRTATDEEKAIYESGIAISCIREDVLIEIIKEKAREIDKR